MLVMLSSEGCGAFQACKVPLTAKATDDASPIQQLPLEADFGGGFDSVGRGLILRVPQAVDTYSWATWRAQAGRGTTRRVSFTLKQPLQLICNCNRNDLPWSA